MWLSGTRHVFLLLSSLIFIIPIIIIIIIMFIIVIVINIIIQYSLLEKSQHRFEIINAHITERSNV